MCQTLPPNVFSHQIFTEYIGHATATAEMKLADGWLATGDIGQVDNDSNIILLDRIRRWSSAVPIFL